MNQLAALVGVFAYLSLLTVGGGMAAFPEMKTLAVSVHHWLTAPQLVHLYSVGQLAPGPNMMMIVPVGYWAGGAWGALLVAIAFFGPTAALTYAVGRGWQKLQQWPWRAAITAGLAPVSIGLLLAGCFTLAKDAIFGLDTAAIAVGVLLALLQTKINPALLVLGSAVIGVISLQ
jgi:chromate transporter